MSDKPEDAVAGIVATSAVQVGFAEGVLACLLTDLDPGGARGPGGPGGHGGAGAGPWQAGPRGAGGAWEVRRIL